MSEALCPVTGSRSAASSGCPGSRMGRKGPRGCAFAAFQMSEGSSYSSHDPSMNVESLRHQERKTLNEILMPVAPPKELTKGLKNADSLNPVDTDVLALALGAPARAVLTRAAEVGPKTGWKDGYLSASHGFCAPDPNASPIALAQSPGRVWSDLCERMPGVVARGKIRQAILELPLVYGDQETIPDHALWAATICLGILASVYRYEEINDGHEGISLSLPANAFKNITGDADDEEEETKGIPRNIAIPLRQVCTRMGRPLPHLTQFDVSIYNYKIRDPTSIHPYVARCENMDLRWPVFNDRGEAMFLLCMAEAHGSTIPAVELITRAQENVMFRNTEGLLKNLIELKTVVDQLPYVFHKISVNPNSGENFANPVEWGQRYAKFSAPLSKRVPALSGLALPFFLLMDAFLGRTAYDSFLGREALHLKAWLPLNIRAFIAAIEYHHQVPKFVKESGDPRLIGVLEGIVESYAGERGFMGTHRYKVYGFLEVVAKTGRTETNGNAGAGDNSGRPWEEVHKTLSDSMKERLDPFRGAISMQPHEMRGSFEECRFKARILGRTAIDRDPNRSTGMVTFDLQDSGITFQPGDRLAVMPLNNWREVAKIAAALGIDAFMDSEVPVEKSSDWGRFAKHLSAVSRTKVKHRLTVRDILRRGHIAPLTRDFIMAFHQALRASSPLVRQLLTSQEWPIHGTLGDLLQKAVTEVPPDIWDRAFDLNNLAWLPKLIPVEVPRTYSISNSSDEFLPSTVDLTVSRTTCTVHPVLGDSASSPDRHGVSSGFLNPAPSEEIATYPDDEEILIGISRPLNFQLPISAAAPIAMFAGGSGIAPFRGFWQARARAGIGRNILFLGVQSGQKFLYENELRALVKSGQLELHTAFSRDKYGLIYDPVMRELIERHMEPRYIDAAIVEQGKSICELVMSTKQGGLGGYLYVCGSVSVYETVMKGIRQALYNHQTSTKESAEKILAIAFAERRFMLDIFMSPRQISYNEPTISMSQLAEHTGHRPNSRMWIGVHGGVYDITDFLPIHPGGTLIAAASAGLDASKTFDDLAHTSNPEVSSLLSKYFIGHLSPKPEFRDPDISELYDMFYDYLRSCVESLTTLSFEVNHIIEDTKVWYSGGLLNMGGVRKFYQFQSRLMQNGFSELFDAKLQELYLRLSFHLVYGGPADAKLPDVMGIVTRARSSPASIKASKEISQLGNFVCNSQSATFFERGVIGYAQAVTELDVQFLEQIRKEVCAGMDAFAAVGQATSTMLGRHLLGKLSVFLLSIVERIAQRLDMFYSSLARETLYRPEMEKNPARTRWRIVRQKIFDGSIFMFGRDLELRLQDTAGGQQFRSAKQAGTDIDFHQVVSRAQRDIDREMTQQATPRSDSGRRGLADNHTARAAQNTSGPSSFETHLRQKAINRMSTFIGSNMQAIRRLSRLPTDRDLSHAISVYGVTGGGATETSRMPPPPPAKSLPDLPEQYRQPARDARGAPPGHVHRSPSVSTSSTRSDSPTSSTNSRRAYHTENNNDTAVPSALNVRQRVLPRNSLGVTSRMRRSSQASTLSGASSGHGRDAPPMPVDGRLLVSLISKT